MTCWEYNMPGITCILWEVFLLVKVQHATGFIKRSKTCLWDLKKVFPMTNAVHLYRELIKLAEMLSLTRSNCSFMQNTKCAHLEKDVSHVLANGEITDHRRLLPHSSYLDTLHILFPASLLLASISPWEFLHWHPCSSSPRQRSRSKLRVTAFIFRIYRNMCQWRISWSHDLKGCHVHRVEKVLYSFLFVCGISRSLKSLLIDAWKGQENWWCCKFFY